MLATHDVPCDGVTATPAHSAVVVTLTEWKGSSMSKSSSNAARIPVIDVPANPEHGLRPGMMTVTQPQPRQQPNMRAKFTEHAEARTSAALGAMDYVQQLFVRQRYHYTDAEAEEILGAFEAKLVEMREAARRGTGREPRFRLSSGRGAAH